jgi:cytochrome c-type biogenesis protein CcmH/NrfF
MLFLTPTPPQTDTVFSSYMYASYGEYCLLSRMLQKHYEQLTQGKSDQRILVPLCGRTLDLSW